MLLLVVLLIHLITTSSYSFKPSFVSKLSSNARSFESLAPMASTTAGSTVISQSTPKMENVLFIECGFGNDSHGQSATKAAVRACRNAIEFNSIPSIAKLVPGGYDALCLHVILAIPPKYQSTLNIEQVKAVFPYYGTITFAVQDGGMVAPSGIAISALGDVNDDMVVVCAAVTVGY